MPSVNESTHIARLNLRASPQDRRSLTRRPKRFMAPIRVHTSDYVPGTPQSPLGLEMVASNAFALERPIAFPYP